MSRAEASSTSDRVAKRAPIFASPVDASLREITPGWLRHRGTVHVAYDLAYAPKLVARDVTVVVLNDTGHWVLEDRPKEATDALAKFLRAGISYRVTGTDSPAR